MVFGSPVDEIKEKLDIADVIQEYIQLRRAGTSFRALCPFHTEKTPSFFVSPDRQIWHCFGCGEGGDIFSFVMKIEGMEFPEALRLLAKKAGVTLRYQDPAISNQKTKLVDIIRDAKNYYHSLLLDSPRAKTAREYLEKRAIRPETMENFNIGFAFDEWDGLNKYLIQKGHKENDIFLAGLTIKKERGVGFYDRFRNRIMFPIFDTHENPIGFGGRLLGEDKDAAKYINTPQTMIYDKSAVLFGIDKAKTELRTKKFAIVVEGYMDVIASHQAGVTNVVSTSGTALTAGQVKLLKRYTENVLFAFDTDIAGEDASKRGLDIALGQELNVRIIDLPVGKDPDECIRHNPDDWQRAIKEAKSIMEYFFDKTMKKVDLKTVEGKKHLAKALLALIAKIPDPIEQTHYTQKLAEVLNVPEQTLRDKLKQILRDRLRPRDQPSAPPPKDRNRFEILSEQLLGIAFFYPEHLNYIIDQLPPECVVQKSVRDLYEQLIIYYTEKHEFDFHDFSGTLKKEAKALYEYANALYFRAEHDFADMDAESVRTEIVEGVKSLKSHFVRAQLDTLEEKIKVAERHGDTARVQEYTHELNELLNQLGEVQS